MSDTQNRSGVSTLTNDEKYLVGDGPELFEIRTLPPNIMSTPDPQSGEPPEPPRFLLNPLPEALRDQMLERGEELPMQSIIEAGVEELIWRQPPRHIEQDLVSEEVFHALKELAPGSVSSIGSIRLTQGESRIYHAWKFHGFPENDLLDSLDDRDKILLPESDPPIPLFDLEGSVFKGDVFKSVTEALRESSEAGRPAPILALPSWMARDDKIIYPGTVTPVVTEGFLKSWRDTDVSKMLWADNYEHDFYFRPWTYWARPNGGVPYKWVDIPE